MNQIPITLSVRDDLSEVVLRKTIESSQQAYFVGSIYGKTGFGYLKRRIGDFKKAARGTPWLVLADLDMPECLPALIAERFGSTKRQHNLLFQVAVRGVEAWLLADRAAFARFTGLKADLIQADVEGLPDPKAHLVDLVNGSRRRSLREAIVPPRGRKQGPD